MLQTGLGSGGEEAMEAAQTARTPSCPHPAASGLHLSSLGRRTRDSWDLRHPPPLPRSLGILGTARGRSLSGLHSREVLGLFPASSVVSVL